MSGWFDRGDRVIMIIIGSTCGVLVHHVKGLKNYVRRCYVRKKGKELALESGDVIVCYVGVT